MDTHALSEPAFASALEVLAANDVEVMIDRARGYTPTPVISHAILTYNRGRKSGLADGIVITPSHNPPADGGFKYNPPNGGPADTNVTGAIEKSANAILADGLRGVKRIPFERALNAPSTHRHDYVEAYVSDLASVVNMEAIRDAGVRIGIDPLGGAGVHYWGPIIERYRIKATVVNDAVDPTFRFMSVDWDGKIRMDCSSPYAMARLVEMKDRFDVAFANDTDTDRHGIVTPSAGLMNPNHYLAVAISYLFKHREGWPKDAAVGKTVVSSSMIDRVTAALGRRLVEVPVGFKWFVDGLLDGSIGFGGEESAGASFLRRDGTVWTTDKDGIIPGLLAAEITAQTGRDPGALYQDLTREFGAPVYERIDAPATAEQKKILGEAVARSDHRQGSRGRENRRDADQRARQRRGDRRAEGGHRQRMVRGAALGHRGGLQNLRRELQRRRSSEEHSGRSAGADREGLRGERDLNELTSTRRIDDELQRRMSLRENRVRGRRHYRFAGRVQLHDLQQARLSPLVRRQ